MKILINLIVPAAIGLYFAYADTRNSLRLQRARCIIADTKDVINANCRTVIVNRTNAVGQIYLFITRPLDNIFIQFQLFKKTDVKYRPFLVDIKEDYCAFFKNNQGSIYMRILYQIYGPYSNLNHSCPYEGDIMIRDFSIDGNLLPSLWPTGEYRLDVIIYSLKSKKFTMEFVVEIKEKRQ